jgi:amino acid transporter
MHLSEEMQHPQIEVPRALVGTIGFDGILGFSILLAVLFGLSNTEAALTSPTGYPIFEISCTMSHQNVAVATAFTSTIVFSAGLATLGLTVSSSRAVWLLLAMAAFLIRSDYPD